MTVNSRENRFFRSHLQKMTDFTLITPLTWSYKGPISTYIEFSIFLKKLQKNADLQNLKIDSKFHSKRRGLG